MISILGEGRRSSVFDHKRLEDELRDTPATRGQKGMIDLGSIKIYDSKKNLLEEYSKVFFSREPKKIEGDEFGICDLQTAKRLAAQEGCIVPTFPLYCIAMMKLYEQKRFPLLRKLLSQYIITDTFVTLEPSRQDMKSTNVVHDGVGRTDYLLLHGTQGSSSVQDYNTVSKSLDLNPDWWSRLTGLRNPADISKLQQLYDNVRPRFIIHTQDVNQAHPCIKFSENLADIAFTFGPGLFYPMKVIE